MHIAVIGSRGIPASFGGIERHVEELYSRLAAMGCEVTIYCRAGYLEGVRNSVTWEVPMRRGTYRGCRLVVSRTPSSKGIEAFAHSLWATLLALFRRYDLYHYHALGPTLFSALPMLLGRPVVATCHGLDWQRGKWGGFSRRFLQFCERFMGRRVRQLICVSEDLKEHFESTYQRKAHYIPNGAEMIPPMEPVDFPEFGLRSGRYVVFFGRLTHEKEVHTLVEAFQRVNTDCRLAIVGGSSHTDEYVAGLKAAADDRIVFTGFAYGEALNRLVANCRFVINPSRMEGLPIVVLEAFALGKRVLASDIPPHRQVIGDEDWLFPVGDSGALGRRIEARLADETPMRDEALLERIRTEYDWDAIARETHRLFERIVERRA